MYESLFETVQFNYITDLAVINLQLDRGRTVYSFTHGLDLGRYYKNMIVRTQLDRILWVSSFNTISSLTQDTISGLTKSKQNMLYRQYGQFDWIGFSPICGLAYFLPTSQSLKDKVTDYYYECGIIHNNKIYCGGNQFTHPFVKEITPSIITQFKHVRSNFLHIPLVKDRLEENLHDQIGQVEYILRTTGYVNRSDSFYRGQISGDRYLSDITQLYHFLKSRSF